jgi:hypothetical protein
LEFIYKRFNRRSHGLALINTTFVENFCSCPAGTGGKTLFSPLFLRVSTESSRGREAKKKNSSRPLPRGRSSRRAKAGERKEKELNHRSRRSSQIRKENCLIFFDQRRSARSADKNSTLPPRLERVFEQPVRSLRKLSAGGERRDKKKSSRGGAKALRKYITLNK